MSAEGPIKRSLAEAATRVRRCRHEIRFHAHVLKAAALHCVQGFFHAAPPPLVVRREAAANDNNQIQGSVKMCQRTEVTELSEHDPGLFMVRARFSP